MDLALTSKVQALAYWVEALSLALRFWLDYITDTCIQT